MQISITVDPGPDTDRSGPIAVGWLLTTEAGGILFDPPQRLASRDARKMHAKSAARCPAVVQMESRYFVVNSPYDLNVGFARDKDGKPVMRNLAGDAGAVRANKLGNVLRMVNENEWRYPDRPTVQMILPYCFIADEPVFITQLGAFAHYRRDPLPGTIFGGRFPIHVWPRQLMWAFEWHDIDKPLILRRGEPLFYCQFEGHNPERPIQMVEAELTADLKEYMAQLSGVVNYVNQTFSLFEKAEQIRPPKLLQRKQRS